MTSRVKRIQHVVLSTDRPPQTDPRGIFADFQGSVNGKTFGGTQASADNTQLLQRHEAMSLLGQHAKAKEMEQLRSAQSSMYRIMYKISSAMPSYFTDTAEDRTPFIGSNEEVYSQADVGFFEAVLLAYSNHWNLRTSPDDWWFCFIKTVSYAIQVNSRKPEVRNMFVDFQGKKNLAVQINDGWPVFEDLDFSSFFDSISSEIMKNVKVPEFVDGVTADFTTTTPVQRIVSQITLMSSLQGYFNFLLLGGCGIPAIEMTGTEEDWKKLLSKLKVVKTLLEPIRDHIGLADAWWSLVTKIFRALLDTNRGHPDEDWWSRIMTYERPYGSGEYLSSGPPRYSGWIVEFLKGKVGSEIGYLIGDFPSAVVTVPLYVTDLQTGENDKGALVAGMVGLTVHESVGNDRVSIQPFQGWSLLLPKDSPLRQKRYAKGSTPATPAHKDSSRPATGHTSKTRKQRRPKH